MPSIINTNISSLDAQLNLGKSQAGLQTALQRLSSGLRINSAADDAAGLAISERMTSQINGLDQAARNANDGVSLSQTAEGGLSSIGDSLQRIRELAVQSANSTNSSSDRAALNAEAQSLLAEIQRVASTTQFNGINLLDGTFAGSQFQVGANADQTITVNLQSSQPSALGSYGGASTAAVTTEGFSATNAISINGTTIGPSVAQTGTAGWTAGSAAAKAAAINAQTGVTGVSATASSIYTGGTPIINQALNNGDLTINGVAIGPIAASTSAATQGANAAAAINLQTNATGVTATADANTGKLTLTASDGRDITISSASTSTATKVLNATGLAADTGQGPSSAVSTATFATGASHLTTGSTVLLNGVTFTFSSTGAGNVVSSATAVSVDVKASATGTQIAAALASAITSAATNSLTQAKLGQYTATSAANSAVTTVTDTKLGTSATTGDVALTLGNGNFTVAATSAGTDYSNGTFSSQAPSYMESLNYGDLIINGTKIGAVAAGTDAKSQGAAVATAINLLSSTTGVTATADTNTGKLTLTSTVAGTPITVSAASGQAEKVLTATGLTADSGTKATQATSTVTTFKTGMGAVSKGMSVVVAGITFSFSSAAATSATINSATSVTVKVGANATGTAAATALAAAINKAALDTGLVGTKAALSTYTATSSGNSISVNNLQYGSAATTPVVSVTQTVEAAKNKTTLATSATTNLTFATAAGLSISKTASVVINGVTFAFASAAGSATISSATNVTVNVAGLAGAKASAEAVALYNAIVKAKADATYGGAITASLSAYTLTAPPASSGTIKFTDAAAATAGTNYVGGSLGLTTGGAIGKTNGGDLTLTASSTFTVTGTGNGVADAGLSSYQVQQTTLASLSIATVSGANQAINTIDAALNQVNSLRANLGATQNRFTSTVSNLQTTALNISAARSQIQDTNYAAETANLTRAQILQQAGTAMLAQANQLPNLVLSLLK